MKKTLLTATSAIAILLSAPAVNAAEKSAAEPGSQAAAESSTGSFTQDAKKAYKNMKKDASEAANTVSEKAKDMYKDAKHALNTDEDSGFEQVNIDVKTTATNMIGKPVYNIDGERVAKVHDIIMSEDGNAMMVILADGEFTGLGKLVAFDYSVLTTRSADGDVIASIDEKTIDHAASFSYEPGEINKEVRIMPSNGYSLSKLLDGELVGAEGEELAAIDNIVFDNGQAEQLIVSVGGTLGMGAKNVALSFDEPTLVPERNGNLNMKLSANQSVQFEAFEKSITN